ncbi:MAG: cobyric acid synthase CobQ, partial [Actinobacteria bacterium]|nr:cobyric acid synthase CobQ [Actinomycetota bacterium]
ICGGYQMLGRRILDPGHVESADAEIAGLGLLDVETTFAGEKRTVRVEGELTGVALGPTGTALRGYEIHMGRTQRTGQTGSLVRLRTADGPVHEDGAASRRGTVCGCYVHGLFDHPALRTAFLNDLRAAAGLPLHGPDAGAAAAGAVTADLDRLADHVQEHLDMAALDEIIGAPS